MYEEYTTYSNGMTFNQFLTKSFGVMFSGVLLTAITALIGTPLFVGIMSTGLLGLILILAVTLGIGIFFSTRFMKMSKTTAYVCFYVYCFVIGLTFSVLPYAYDGKTLAFALFMTAGMFGCMAIIGHTTKVDFTRFAPYLAIGMLFGIIVTIVNLIFIHSSGLELLIDYAMIAVFLILIAYDMQALRKMHESSLYDIDLQDRLSIYGAFSLYLDFVNLFTRVLSVLGRSSDQ